MGSINDNTDEVQNQEVGEGLDHDRSLRQKVESETLEFRAPMQSML